VKLGGAEEDLAEGRLVMNVKKVFFKHRVSSNIISSSESTLTSLDVELLSAVDIPVSSDVNEHSLPMGQSAFAV